MFADGRATEFHRLAVAVGQRRVGQAGNQLPRRAAQQLLERPADHAQRRPVGKDVAILPVEGHEGLVDLLEKGSQPALAVGSIGCRTELAQAALQGGWRAERGRVPDHPYL